MTSSHPLPASCQWFARLASALDCRSAPRLARLFLGAVLARGRRTVTTWIREAKLSDRVESCYTAVAAAGKRADRIARRLLTMVGRGTEHPLSRPHNPYKPSTLPSRAVPIGLLEEYLEREQRAYKVAHAPAPGKSGPLGGDLSLTLCLYVISDDIRNNRQCFTWRCIS
jgi:hypothetical protein